MANYGDWTEFLWNAPSVFDRNRAPASFDTPHNFQLAGVWELPFGTGKPWATTGLSNAVLGRWQLNGVFSAYSGRPFTLTASGASLNMPHNQQTPDQIKDTVEILGNVGDATYSTRPRSSGSRKSGSETWAGTACAAPVNGIWI